MFIDTHCHLDDPAFAGRLSLILDEARRAGVGRFIVPAVVPDAWPRISNIAMEHAGVYPALGIHPMHANLCTDAVLSRLASLCGQVVAIGEIGLDYQISHPPREVQISAFRSQLRVAVTHGLPVLLHCRRAFQDMLEIMREEAAGRVAGVMHAFSGSAETAAACIQLGLFISVAGPITWQKAVKPLGVVRQVPLESLLLETDAPDLAPEPHRGKANEPAFIIDIARKVAEIKGVSMEEVAEVTTRNAERLFQLNNR